MERNDVAADPAAPLPDAPVEPAPEDPDAPLDPEAPPDDPVLPLLPDAPVLDEPDGDVDEGYEELDPELPEDDGDVAELPLEPDELDFSPPAIATPETAENANAKSTALLRTFIRASLQEEKKLLVIEQTYAHAMPL